MQDSRYKHEHLGRLTEEIMKKLDYNVIILEMKVINIQMQEIVDTRAFNVNNFMNCDYVFLMIFWLILVTSKHIKIESW